MTKAQLIRDGLARGLSNEEILALSVEMGMATTLNSIRWYRSKESSPTPSPRRPIKPKPTATVIPMSGLRTGMKVSTAIEGLDLKERILKGLRRFSPEKAEIILANLDKWYIRIQGRANGRSGRCSYSRREIELHEVLMADHFKEERVQTLLHEIAHAVNTMIFGHNDGHGYNWKSIMVAFGCQPNRTTCEAVSRELRARKKPMKVFETWECDRCGERFPRSKKSKYPAETYHHKGCGGHFKVV